MRKTKQTFYFEMTDTFGGETNYCWLHRFIIEAQNLKGALIKLSKESGYNFRFDGCMYKAKKACVAAYIIDYDVNNDWMARAIKL